MTLPVRMLPVRMLPVRMLPVRMLPVRKLAVRVRPLCLVPACVLLACEGRSPVDPSEPEPACSATGTTVTAVTAPTVWTRSSSPYHLTEEIAITSRLTVEAGTLVCGTPGGGLVLGTAAELDVRGTAVQKATFTARDTAARWGGIRTLPYSQQAQVDLRPAVTVRHAVIEWAEVAFNLERADFAIDSTLIRQITGVAVRAGPAATGSVRGSVIDTAAIPGGAAVWAQSNRHAPSSTLVLENSVVRGSRGIGAAATSRGVLSLLGVRIEGSARTGIVTSNGPVPWDIGWLDGLRAPIRVTGGATFPADVGLSDAARLVALQPVDSLLGNGRDTLLVGRNEVSSSADTIVIPAGLPWAVSTGTIWGVLRLQPGAVMTVSYPWMANFSIRSEIVAEGREDAPVVIRGQAGILNLWPGTRGRFTHVRFEDIRVVVQGEGSVLLSDVRAVRTSFSLGGDAVIRRLLSEEPTGTFVLSTGDVEDLTVLGSASATGEPGLTLNGPVSIRRCEITGMRSDAIRVAGAASPRITACNLFDNGGVGLRNAGTGRVDARGNWWGDPAGPLGPTGDGVAGAVDYEPFLTVPAARPERPQGVRAAMAS